jgi:protein deglycase
METHRSRAMTVLVPVAHGSESIETVCIVNVLRRAEIAVTVASIEKTLAVEGTRGVTLTADALFADVAKKDFELIALPGGEKGAAAFAACKPLIEKLTAQRMAHRWYGAICASPALVLSPHGLLDGKQATCYPAFRDKLIHYVNQPVVVDGHCITSQGPATAIAFGLKLVEVLSGADKARAVASQTLAN